MSVDGLTGLGLTILDTPILPASAGALDANGNATTDFHLPAGITRILTSFRFTLTGTVFDAAWRCDVVGGPATLLIAP